MAVTGTCDTPLARFFAENPQVTVALSGGVDSAVLLWAAREAGAEVRAYFVDSPFQPAFEKADARAVAEATGVELTVLPLDVLAVPGVAENGPDRCYFCKRAIFEAIARAAAADGFPLVVDGTNASDDADARPGMRALRELGVQSPLRECGVDKALVRKLAREAGLAVHDKPSYACLATRIPCGETITAAALEATDAAEEALRTLGFRDFRIRWFHGCARLQVREEQLSLVAKEREAVLAVLAPHYDGVLVDLEVREDEWRAARDVGARARRRAFRGRSGGPFEGRAVPRHRVCEG